MSQKIKDYYIQREGGEIEFDKRVIKETADKPKMEVGEILHFPKFEDVVYTEKQTEFMRLALEKLKKERLNLLFCGYAGTGKTYSSKMLAAETGRKYVYLNGNYSKDKLLNIMQNLTDGSLVCIDEIHNLRENTAELIYPAIEDNEISIDGMMIKLNNIIFVGTTTEPEKLPRPLLDRFMRIEFEEPPIEIMKKILAKRSIPNDCIDKLLNFTINIRIIKKIIDYVELYGEKNLKNFVKVFKVMKINLYSGLSEEQEKYIDYLKKVGKASVRNLGFVLRRSENYIKADIQPDLIRKEMIAITSRGRELNPEFDDCGYEQLQKVREEGSIPASTPGIEAGGGVKKFNKDERARAIKWLNDNPNIKKQFSSMYLELVSFIAEKIKEGIEPDLIDFESFGTDTSIENSYNNNYKDGFLEDL